MNHRTRLIAAACTASCLSVLFGVGAASAHIGTDPAAVEAGASATVGFRVGHGCDGSNTTRVDIKMPDGVTDAVAVEKAGWTTSVADGTVSFSDGDLDAETAETFEVTFTAPATPGTVYFPIVQTCAVGFTPWIEIPTEGGPEPEHPAAALNLTDGPPTSADLDPGHDEAETAEATETTETTGGSVIATTATVEPNTSAASTPPSVTESASDDDDDDSNTGAVVGIAAGVVVVLGGAAVVAAKRKKG